MDASRKGENMADSLTHWAFIGTCHPSANVSDADLLYQIGIRGMQRFAGYMPRKSADILPEIADDDDKSLCDSATLTQFVWLMQNSKFNSLRSVWLSKFTETGQRLPDELLPSLMDKHSRFGAPQFQNVVGKRAQWLADLSEIQRWQQFNSYKPSNSSGRFLSRFGRHAEYRQLRCDKAPEAQLWLNTYWDGASISNRLGIFNIMREKLSEDDLPFLIAQVEELDDIQDAEILQEVWYLLSLLKPAMLEDTIRDVGNLVHFDFTGRRSLPILDLRSSNSFHGHAQYVQYEMLRKLTAKNLWRDSLSQLIRLVPLNYWLQKWDITIQELLDGAHNGLHSDLFIQTWQERAIDEGHEDFALELLRRQHPQVKRFGWHVSKQGKLVSSLSFESLKILLDEEWMPPEKVNSDD